MKDPTTVRGGKDPATDRGGKDPSTARGGNDSMYMTADMVSSRKNGSGCKVGFIRNQ